MDIGEIEKIGDREMPGMPALPKTLPAVTPQRSPEPSKAPVAPTPEKEKVPA